jgi:hypothetical protein
MHNNPNTARISIASAKCAGVRILSAGQATEPGNQAARNANAH